MKTPIKSFEIIKGMYEYFVEHFRDLEPKLMICEKEDFDNVETTLKDYELMKEIRITARFDLAQVNKEHKALEIIKEKGLSLLHKSLIISSKNYKEYRQEFQLVKSREFKNEYFYSQEEYDLLKEVLL